MGKNLETQYSFRCDKETIKKLEFIASQNTRTRNQEMKHIIKEYISKYEKEYGEIQIEKESIVEQIIEIAPGGKLGGELADITLEKIPELRNTIKKIKNKN